jgi:hypothetical protein
MNYAAMAMFLSRFILGRMLLHAGCLLRGGRRDHHLAGIRREFSCLMSGLHRFGKSMLAGLMFCSVFTWSPRAGAEVPADLFLTPSTATIYRKGWIDFTKNGVKDPYEDLALEADRRIDDLLGRMTLDEQTAQMVTLYGFPCVLKDELPTPEWKNRLWKDGIGNIDEHMNGNLGSSPLRRPKHDWPWSLHVRAKNEAQRFFVEENHVSPPVSSGRTQRRGLGVMAS